MIKIYYLFYCKTFETKLPCLYYINICCYNSDIILQNYILVLYHKMLLYFTDK